MLRKFIPPMLGWVVICMLGTGCATSGPLFQPNWAAGDGARHDVPPDPIGLPNEKDLVSFPPYVIEPPDILLVDVIQAGGVTKIRGDHLVCQDGTINLGPYGDVRVVGMTLAEARQAIEKHLSAKLVKPEVSVSVSSYNSKFYYVIMDGRCGAEIYRLPNMGKETVLDALAQIDGLPPVSSRTRMWVARPAPPGSGCRDQILPVNYCGITRGGQTETNYQLLPGDRVYVTASR